MSRTGFTLIEITVAMSILSVVSLLSFVVIKSAVDSQVLTDAKAEVQANLRDVLAQLTTEVQSAYSERLAGTLEGPKDAVPISVGDDGASITFMVPVVTNDATMVTNSTPITYRFVNEDTDADGTGPNAKLDDGEDVDEDGVLSRRIVREQVGVATVVGAVNDVSDVLFTLMPSVDGGNDQLTTLNIRLASSKRYGPNDKYLIRAAVEGRVHLEN